MACQRQARFARRFAARHTRDSDDQTDLLQQAHVTLVKIDATALTCAYPKNVHTSRAVC